MDPESLVKDNLERLFWIEIAKRKATIEQPELFSRLLTLRREIEEYFDTHQPASTERLQGGADMAFNNIQGLGRHLEACIELEAHKELLAAVVDRFGDHVRTIEHDLIYCQGFRLADFSVTTDLLELNGWWRYINSIEGRNELGAKGNYSPIGERSSNEEGVESTTFTVASCPVRIPLRVHPRKIWAYDSDSDDIVINGHRFQNSVVLAFDVNKRMPSMREVELALRQVMEAARGPRTESVLVNGGIVPDEISLWNDENLSSAVPSLMVPPSRDHQLMKGQNSFAPMLKGLYGWDLVQKGKSMAASHRQTASAFGNGKDEPDESEIRNVKTGFDVVETRIKDYEPARLPWND